MSDWYTIPKMSGGNCYRIVGNVVILKLPGYDYQITLPMELFSSVMAAVQPQASSDATKARGIAELVDRAWELNCSALAHSRG